MSKKLQMFIPLTKVDAEKRLVYGIATCEKMDRSKQICDYETTKPFYQKWSEGIEKASGGKSFGNVRAMHGKSAAGKITELVFNDEAKQIEVCSKVVDDNEWNKVLEGVYTGFSQGGSYVKVWKDSEGNERYTADPIELSLVDIPCLPDATFTMVQMAKGGALEEVQKAFTSVCVEPSVTEIGNRAEALAKAASTDVLKKNWQDYTDAARIELLEAKHDAALEAFEKAAKKDDPKDDEDEDSNDDTGADDEDESKKDDEEADGKDKPKKKDKKKKAEKYVEPVQVWKCNCGDHNHLNKAEAVKCMKAEGAKDNAAEAIAPLTGALAKLNAALGNKPTTLNVPELNGSDDEADVLKAFIKAWKPGDDVPADKVAEILAFVDADSEIAKAISVDAKTHTTQGDVMKALQKALAAQPLKKGLYTVSRFACLLSELKWLHDDATIEAMCEEDDSEVPAKIKAGVMVLIEALQAMVAEECAELFPDDGVDVEVLAAGLSISGADALVKFGGAPMKKHGEALKKAVTVETDLEKTAVAFETTRDGLPETAKDARDQLDKCAAYVRGLSKAGARHSKQDVEMIQTMHDTALALGALCGDGDVEKGAGGDALAKLENVELRKRIDEITPQIATLTEQVTKLLAEPRVPKAKVSLVNKGAGDGAEDDAATVLAKQLEGMTPDERNKELMKLALKTGNNGHPAHSNR